MATVLSNQPDFITYNEVPFRPDAILAPPGYALFRTPGQYTGETPVAWRTDSWTAINQGTTTVSYKKGQLPGQKVEWGIRYANWVTLQGIDGHVISVISAHLAPRQRDHPGPPGGRDHQPRDPGQPAGRLRARC